MRIRTEHLCPPIGTRDCDWSAVDDATYDGHGCPMGFGATEAAAVEDLIRELEADGVPADTLAEGLAEWLERKAAA